MVRPRFCGWKPAGSLDWFLFTIAPRARIIGARRWSFMRIPVAVRLRARWDA